MRRTFFIVTLGVVALGLMGCTGSAPQASRPPQLPEKETRAPAPARPEPPPRLIAPPPAYGNKIVMAESQSEVENF